MASCVKGEIDESVLFIREALRYISAKARIMLGSFDKKQVEITLDEGTNYLALEKPVENASIEELPPTKVQL